MAEDEAPKSQYDPQKLSDPQAEIMKALKQQAWLGNLGEPAASDRIEKLARLAELHKQGVLSDTEFDFAKRKLLDSDWDPE
jgi:hypothetical protein